MGTTEDKIKEFKEREEKELVMGGGKQIQKQHDKGKLTARERLDLLFDQGSFRELDMFIRHRCIHFDMPETFIPGEGVVTGHGTVKQGLPLLVLMIQEGPGYRKEWIPLLAMVKYFSETPLPLE
jgi:acetyl-CoA carboxylase carboxyltransferase component